MPSPLLPRKWTAAGRARSDQIRVLMRPRFHHPQSCNDVLPKKKVDAHKNVCWNASFTCLDCMQHFVGTDYRAHTVRVDNFLVELDRSWDRADWTIVAPRFRDSLTAACSRRALGDGVFVGARHDDSSATEQFAIC